jgi:hypothetical protein
MVGQPRAKELWGDGEQDVTYTEPIDLYNNVALFPAT